MLFLFKPFRRFSLSLNQGIEDCTYEKTDDTDKNWNDIRKNGRHLLSGHHVIEIPWCCGSTSIRWGYERKRARQESRKLSNQAGNGLKRRNLRGQERGRVIRENAGKAPKDGLGVSVWPLTWLTEASANSGTRNPPSTWKNLSTVFWKGLCIPCTKTTSTKKNIIVMTCHLPIWNISINFSINFEKKTPIISTHPDPGSTQTPNHPFLPTSETSSEFRSHTAYIPYFPGFMLTEICAICKKTSFLLR